MFYLALFDFRGNVLKNKCNEIVINLKKYKVFFL